MIDARHERFRNFNCIDKDNASRVRTAEDVLKGTRLLDNHELRVQNLTSVFNAVESWASDRKGVLLAAFLTAESDKVTLFFVSAADSYDVDLDAAMTDLEVRLGGSSGVGSVESFQIPPQSVDQFVSSRAVLIWAR